MRRARRGSIKYSQERRAKLLSVALGHLRNASKLLEDADMSARRGTFGSPDNTDIIKPHVLAMRLTKHQVATVGDALAEGIAAEGKLMDEIAQSHIDNIQVYATTAQGQRTVLPKRKVEQLYRIKTSIYGYEQCTVQKCGKYTLGCGKQLPTNFDAIYIRFMGEYRYLCDDCGSKLGLIW